MMNMTVCSFKPGDWVTTIGDHSGTPLLNQLLVKPTVNSRALLNPVVEENELDNELKSVFVRSKKEPLKEKRKSKTKKSRRGRMAPAPPVTIVRRENGDIERSYFVPYIGCHYQYNNLYKSVMPKYLNGTVASELKRFPREYWPCRYYTPTPFVASCVTRNTHNVMLLKQETFAKIKAAVLPFKSKELNDQNINSLRSIKRSIEKHWKL